MYTLTRVYVLLLVCDIFPGRQVPPNRPSCLKERVIGVSQTEGGLEEGSGGGVGWGGLVMLPELFLSSSSSQNHTIPLLILIAQAELSKLPVPPLCCCQRKAVGSFWLRQEVSNAQKTEPNHASDEWTRGKQQSEEGGKNSQAWSAVSASSERCASV